ncbi:TPA: apolipoprotein N-acyltransferase [Candidatus Delongbacteria bacterium]|nr:MAG: apolipoprotein N-acyltransferase [Candidatus Delongbacteria bacterium GWF2_40_14]HAQ61604.1 apolipoprotein N-acyltransferase [Candidatus Delongbacteria bacterium]
MKTDKNELTLTIPVILSGLILGLCFPPFASTYAVLLLLLPFIHSIYLMPERSAKFGFLFGFSMSVTALYWIFSNAGADALWIKIVSGFGMFVVNATFYSIFGLLYKASHKIFRDKAIWTVPLLWGGMEHLMQWEEFAFPWTLLAHLFTGKTKFIQIAEFTGAISVSMLMIFISVILYLGIKYFSEKKYFSASVTVQCAIFITIGLVLFGHFRMDHFNSDTEKMPSIKATMIHPSLEIEEKWKSENFNNIVNTQFALSGQSLNENPDLIIWGESNFPKYLENNPSFMRDFILYSANKKVDLCIGSLGYDYFPNTETFNKYNSVFFFDQNNNISRYDKRKLVPFGERFPLSQYLTFLEEISLGQANFDKGTNTKPFVMTNGHKFSSNVCYEGVFPYYNAMLVRNGSEFIVNVSNDAWYECSKQIYQHSRFTVFRAIENRRSIIRLANKAENSVFLPSGEQKILFDHAGSLYKVVDVPMNNKLTFFTRYGYWFARLTILLNSAILLLALIMFAKDKTGKK